MSPRRIVRATVAVHIVILAWLFIAFTMALTMRAVAGTLFFLLGGLLPVLLYTALALRRRRAARGRPAPSDPTTPSAGS